MAGRRKFYRLYISGELVAQGDADFLADLIGIKPDTLQHYGYSSSKPAYISLEPLPLLYVYKRTVLTIDELESSLGMNRHGIWMSLSDHKAIRGHMVKRYEYESFSLPRDDIRHAISEKKAENRKQGGGSRA